MRVSSSSRTLVTFAAVSLTWTPTTSFWVQTVRPFSRTALDARRRRKEQSRQDIDRWYDKVNEDASPDDVFWEEMERQRLLSQLSGSNVAGDDAITAAMKQGLEGGDGATSYPPSSVGTASTAALTADSSEYSPGISPTLEETRSTEETLASYGSNMVDNNWLDERFQKLEHDPVLFDLVRKSGSENDHDDDGDDDDGGYDGYADEEDSRSDISDEYVEEGEADDTDDFSDELDFMEEPWDTWGRNVTDDGVARLPRSKLSNEFLYDIDTEDAAEAAAEEQEFVDRLSWIKLKSRRLQRARASSRAEAFFARAPDAIEGFDRMWVAAIDIPCYRNLVGVFRNYGVQFADNFGDWEYGCPEDGFRSIEDLASFKARKVHEVTGLPCIASRTSFEVEPAGTPADVINGAATSPYAGSRGSGGVRGVSPRVASGYRFNDVGDHVDYIVKALKPLSERSRVTRFTTCLCYYDGEMELYDYGVLDCDLYFCSSIRTFIPMASAITEMCKTLQVALDLDYQKWLRPNLDDDLEMFGSACIRLRDRVLREAKVLPNDIIDVSAFMDSMVDVDLMDECGQYLGSRFADVRPTKILTVATTGLVIAIPMGKHLQVPVVYARKERNVVMADTFNAAYSSKTVGKNRELFVSRSHLDEEDRILIVDDFLSSGSSQEALMRIVAEAGAECVGVAVLLEKVYDSGRQSLSGYNVPVESMVRVASVKDGILQLVEEDGFEGL